MSDLQAPIINWQIKKGDTKAGFGEQRVLIIAQGAGTATPKELQEDVQQTEIVALCGAGSMATRAYNRFREHNLANEVDIITLAEPTGTPAQGGFTIVGTATESKNITYRVGDDEYVVTTAIISGDTDSAIALKVIDDINALDYPFTASIDGGDDSLVLIDFDIDGEIANGLTVVLDTLRVAGLEFIVIPFTGGAGAYDSANILDTLTKRYQTVLFDEAMVFDDVETFLQSRVNLTNTVKGGSGFKMLNGTISTTKAVADAKNSQTMTIFANVDEMKMNALPMLAIAEFGAKRALRLTEGAVLGDLVIEAVEAFGGIEKSSLPYHNTPMTYKLPKTQITIEQVVDLNDSGLSLIIPTDFGTVLGTIKTLYKKDGTGTDDTTFSHVNAMDTSFAVQEYLFNNSQAEFGQTRATQGDLVAGVAMTNEGSVSAFIAGLYQDMVDLALAQGGKEAMKAFKKTLVVTLDAPTGVYSVVAPTAIVQQFRGLNGVVPISFEFK